MLINNIRLQIIQMISKYKQNELSKINKLMNMKCTTNVMEFMILINMNTIFFLLYY